MTSDITVSKKELRRKMLQRRGLVDERTLRKTSAAAVSRFSDYIANTLPSSAHRPLTIMSYMSFGNEFPSTDLNRFILRNGWRLVLPFTDRDFRIIACVTDSLETLRLSRMGIPEPDPSAAEQVTAAETDLILLPGIAFDRRGGRLGYGKGCYDRFLTASEGKLPPTLALTWSFQIVDEVPTDEHDHFCDALFTENELIPAQRNPYRPARF